MTVRAIAFVAVALVVMLALCRIGDDRHPLVVEATPATIVCNPTIPPHLARKTTGSLT